MHNITQIKRAAARAAPTIHRVFIIIHDWCAVHFIAAGCGHPALRLGLSGNGLHAVFRDKEKMAA